MASWFTRAFRKVKHFIGKKMIPGIVKAGTFIGKKILPIVSGIASNPLIQAGASAAFGPSAGMVLNGIGQAANFGSQAFNTLNRTVPGIKGVVGDIKRGDVDGSVAGILRTGNDLASLHNQYRDMRQRR